ncbi:amino acid permease [Mycolicibacterium sp.]|uniref:amino acid permease n=1 Tax=Mycolicibacterium sp. TaxID=2320850 RepID=UPI0037C6C80D
MSDFLSTDRRTDTTDDRNDDKVVNEFGYEPQLRRSMGKFSTFAISFSLMSVTTGIFANYAFGLGKAGPSFIWTWPVVALGNILIALVLAHLATQVPLAGYAYQWPARMVSRRYGWFPGWLGLAAWLTGTPGVAYALAQYFTPYVGLGTSVGTIVIVTVAILLSWMVIHLVGLKLAAVINNASVITEIAGSLLVGVGLLIYALLHHVQDFNFLTAGPSTAQAPTIALLAAAALMAAYTLTGFEGAADLAEESHEPRRIVPTAMVLSIVISAVLGFVVLLGFELATPDPAAIQSSSVPLLDIAGHYLGVFTPAFMALVFVSIYACGLINMAAMTRLAFSMSRDNILPFSKAISSVSTRNSPYVAVVAATFISTAFVLFAKVEAIITSVSAVAIYLSYALVILGGWRVGQQPPTGMYFSLGRAFRPLAVLALGWIFTLVIGLLIAPGSWITPLTLLGVVVLGFLWYFVRVRNVAGNE